MSKLTDVAEQERQKNVSKNDYQDVDAYSAGHKDALSDGDNKGKGETTTIGSKTDILSRNQQVSKNTYSDQNIYNG